MSVATGQITNTQGNPLNPTKAASKLFDKYPSCGIQSRSRERDGDIFYSAFYVENGRVIVLNEFSGMDASATNALTQMDRRQRLQR